MMTKPPTKDYYRPDEVAQILGIAKSTVYNFIAEGKLEAKRVGETKLVRVKSESVLDLLNPID